MEYTSLLFTLGFIFKESNPYTFCTITISRFITNRGNVVYRYELTKAEWIALYSVKHNKQIDEFLVC